MLELNRDIFYLIFEELRYDKNTLRSCLLVNKTSCGIITSILWKDPWKFLMKGKEKLLLNVIFSHLSDELKNNLRSQGINFLRNSYQRPLFDYVSFCRHLNLNEINRIITSSFRAEYKIPIVQNVLFKLFINENAKFTHLYVPQKFNHQIHLVPGAKRCFSKLEFLHCNTSINDDVLVGLTEICKSVKELELFIEQYDNNHGITRLIEIPQKLHSIRFQTHHQNIDQSFRRILEDSLIKHANTIQYFKIVKQPIVTKVLSSFVNLKELELDDNFRDMSCNFLENLSLPFLQSLNAKCVPIDVLTSLIENTGGYLTEVKTDLITHDDINNKRIIQAIYQNCPNLKYLKLLIKNSNILELEKLLIGCRYLNGLFIIVDNMNDAFDWDKLFEVLTKSSPTNLFKFKFTSIRLFKLESLKLFLDNWKGKLPMMLQILMDTRYLNFGTYYDLIKKYKAEGIIKKFDNCGYGTTFEDFEWIRK